MEYLSELQLQELRRVFFAHAVACGEPLIDALTLCRLLELCGVASTEADAHRLILRADVTGRGLLSEPDFLQLMTLPLADVEPRAEVDALYDELAIDGVLTPEAMHAFLERTRAEEGTDSSTSPRMTAEEVQMLCADVALAPPAGSSPGTISRADFARWMDISIVQ